MHSRGCFDGNSVWLGPVLPFLFRPFPASARSQLEGSQSVLKSLIKVKDMFYALPSMVIEDDDDPVVKDDAEGGWDCFLDDVPDNYEPDPRPGPKPSQSQAKARRFGLAWDFAGPKPPQAGPKPRLPGQAKAKTSLIVFCTNLDLETIPIFEDLGFRNLLLCLDTFQVTGPNGVHNVIATDPAILFSSFKVDLEEHGIIRQLFHGVSFLHKHGVVASRFAPWKYRRRVSLLAHRRSERINESFPTSHLPFEEASSIVVKLLDFGCAFRPGTNGVLLEDQGDPALVLKAPECIISKLITNVLAPVLISDNTGTALTPPAESQRAMPTVDPLGKAPLVSSGAGLPRIFASRYLGPLPPKFRMLLEEAALDKIQRTTMGEDMDRLIGVHRIESDQASDALNIDISQLPTAAVEANWARLEQQTLAA
ncbi:hypothetical protein B0H17DRAFT_1144113 [Mycena rosella]|uniref:Uncharacterized protein n=1 Tax=Mycena rosella TaxID=1033263 RepID=A0AAD7CTR0_MYCRO|nr:hypothetical protein B0H17DRAFT_1144113 [Mycena rosella]